MERRDFMKFAGYSFVLPLSYKIGSKNEEKDCEKVEFDNNRNIIHCKSTNSEIWQKFDKNNNLIYWRNSKGDIIHYQYDKNNELICSYSNNNKFDMEKINLMQKKLIQYSQKT